MSIASELDLKPRVPPRPSAESDPGRKPEERPSLTATPVVKSSGARSRRVRWAVIGVAAVAAIFAIVRASRPAQVQVVATEATQGPLVVSVTEDGESQVRNRYAVSAPIGGTLRRVTLRAGDSVRQGMVVARIVPLAPALLDARTRRETEARLQAAQAVLRQADAVTVNARTAAGVAQRDAARREALLAGGAVAAQDAEQATATARMRLIDVEAAEAGRRAAAEEVARIEAVLNGGTAGGASREVLEVRAPVTGRILRILQESESAVQAGAILLEIGDPGQLELRVDVLSTDAVSIRLGAPVTLDRWGGERPLHGRVTRIEPSAFTQLSSLGVEEQRVNIIVQLDSAEATLQLGDGYRVEARIVTWETPSTLRVSAGAVFRHADAWAVYRIQEDRARLTPVEIGRGNGELMEVLSGLRAGERVINYPGDNISDGIRVRSRP